MRHTIVISVLFLLGCPRDPTLPEVHLARHCDGRALEPCELHDEACRRKLFEYVACLTEVDPAVPMPEVRFVAETEIEARFAAAVDADEEQRIRAAHAALALAHLVDPALDAFTEAAQVRASAYGVFFDRADRAFLIASASNDALESDLWFAREAALALLDRERELSGSTDLEHDRRLAQQALVNGEAFFYAYLVQLTFDGEIFSDALPDSTTAVADDSAATCALVRPSPYFGAEPCFMFYVGEAWVENAWAQGQAASIAALYDRPPVSSAELMEGFTHRRVVSSTTAALSDRPPPLPPELSGFTVTATLALGRWNARVFDVVLAGSTDEILDTDPTEGLRGDRFFGFRDPSSGADAFLWFLRWREDADLTNLETFVARSRMHVPGNIAVATCKRVVVLAGASDPAALPLWVRTATSALSSDCGL